MREPVKSNIYSLQCNLTNDKGWLHETWLHIPIERYYFHCIHNTHTYTYRSEFGGNSKILQTENSKLNFQLNYKAIPELECSLSFRMLLARWQQCFAFVGEKIDWDSIIWWIYADGHFSFEFPYKQNFKNAFFHPPSLRPPVPTLSIHSIIFFCFPFRWMLLFCGFKFENSLS